MSKHTRFDGFREPSRYDELYHDARLALWREQYERSMLPGAPAPDLPHEVELAVIRSARLAQSRFMADVLSWPFRRLFRFLRAAWRGSQ